MIFALAVALAAAPQWREEASQRRIALIGEWDESAWRQVAAGLEALPDKLRDFPGGVLELELHASPAPFGMGDGAELADWSAGSQNVHRRFHLYGFAETDERRATFRLSALSPTEREQLWRARAMVHAVMQRWEDALHSSQTQKWRRINGWVLPLERAFTWSPRALNLANGAYSRARGRNSPSLDWLTFAEEYFVPAEALRADALSVDDQVRCQEFSKSRALEALLHQHGLMEMPSATPCPAFDRWADTERLDHIELLLVQASGRAPESLFGHVLLRPVYVNDGQVRGESFETAIQIAAITDPVPNFRYLWRGITGGYRMTVFTLSLRDLKREMLEDEQRSIRRFRLELSPTEARRVLERTWEIERRGQFDYQFFSDNCATALSWLLQSALDDDARIASHGWFIVAPGAVVDELAFLETLSGPRPLLTALPELYESSVERAGRSEREMNRLAARIAELDTDRREEWSVVLRELESPEPSARAKAWQLLAELSATAPFEHASLGVIRQRPSAPLGVNGVSLGSKNLKPAVALRETLYEFWAHAVRVERARADAADFALRQLSMMTLVSTAVPFDVDAELVAREQMFERESELDRNQMILDRAAQLKQWLDTQPHRPYSHSEEQKRARAAATVALFDEVTQLHGGAVDTLAPEAQGYRWLEGDGREASDERSTFLNRAQEASGHWRLEVGFGLSHAAQETWPVLRVATSGIKELLGDQRQRGFQPSAELRALELESSTLITSSGLKFDSSRFTLFGYRSIRRDPTALREGVFSKLGWGIDANTDYRVERLLPVRTTLSGELVFPLANDLYFRHLLAASLGTSFFFGWGDGPVTGAAGAYLSLNARVGVGAHALRFTGRWQTSRLTRAESWLHEAQASLSAELRLGTEGRGLWLRPTVAARGELWPGQPLRPAMLAALMLEPY